MRGEVIDETRSVLVVLDDDEFRLDAGVIDSGEDVVFFAFDVDGDEVDVVHVAALLVHRVSF